MTSAPAGSQTHLRTGAMVAALTAFARGVPVVVLDDEAREDEGDVVVAAQLVTAEHIAFMMSECRGLICVAMSGGELDRLQLPPMTSDNQESHRTAFTVSVDARDGIATGISASDRARTARLLGDGATGPDDLVRPGHLFPLRAADGGLRDRQGHTEAAVELALLCALRPAAVICEVADRAGRMLREPGLRAFALDHGLPIVTIEEIRQHVIASASDRRHAAG